MFELTNNKLFFFKNQTTQVLIGFDVFCYFSRKGPQQNSLDHSWDFNVFKTRSVGFTSSVLVLVGSQKKKTFHRLFSWLPSKG